MLSTMETPNEITGANAGGPRQLAIRMRWAARIAQFCRYENGSFGRNRGFTGENGGVGAVGVAQVGRILGRFG